MDNNLSISNESIQRVFDWYMSKRFMVNRKYQRKLVWTIEEKKAFVDSISRQYSVPLFLLAEQKSESDTKYEIIDGMQRLDAIFSFIQNEFKLENENDIGYFDLNTMALTKQMLDEGKLKQKKPVLKRDICTKMSNYPLPFSIIDFEDKVVEEIFRRINSSGRQLSKQDLRQAGAICKFSEVVRKIANKVRRDFSSSDILDLCQMRNISLSNNELHYGIILHDVFWVKQGIITIKNMRESMDEQMIGQILAYMLLKNKVQPTSHSLDVLYGVEGIENEGKKLYEKAEDEIIRIGEDNIISKFMDVMDEFEKIFDMANKSFAKLVCRNHNGKVRSFQVIFLAIYSLKEESKKIADYNYIIEKLDNLGDRELYNVGIKNWNSTFRDEKIGAVKSILEKGFSNVPRREVSQNNISFLENILRDTCIEEQMIDFKIGFCNLTDRANYNKECLSKIVKTLTAMVNTHPDKNGYVIVGIADKKEDADKHSELYDEEYRIYNHHYITGINSEMKKQSMSPDVYWEKIRKEIEKEPISPEMKSIILINMRELKYFEKDVILFDVRSNGSPQMYDGKYFERNASSVVEVTTGDGRLEEMMRRVFKNNVK